MVSRSGNTTHDLGIWSVEPMSVELSQGEKYARPMEEMEATGQRLKEISLVKPVLATKTEVSTKCGVKDPSVHTSCGTYRQDRGIRRRAFKKTERCTCYMGVGLNEPLISLSDLPSKERRRRTNGQHANCSDNRITHGLMK